MIPDGERFPNFFRVPIAGPSEVTSDAPEICVRHFSWCFPQKFKSELQSGLEFLRLLFLLFNKTPESVSCRRNRQPSVGKKPQQQQSECVDLSSVLCRKLEQRTANRPEEGGAKRPPWNNWVISMKKRSVKRKKEFRLKYNTESDQSVNITIAAWKHFEMVCLFKKNIIFLTNQQSYVQEQ